MQGTGADYSTTIDKSQISYLFQGDFRSVFCQLTKFANIDTLRLDIL